MDGERESGKPVLTAWFDDDEYELTAVHDDTDASIKKEWRILISIS